MSDPKERLIEGRGTWVTDLADAVLELGRQRDEALAREKRLRDEIRRTSQCHCENSGDNDCQPCVLGALLAELYPEKGAAPNGT